MVQKKVAAIHDISCFGKCSLTVALPILSAAGIETSILPTAVLSTHTGGFTGFTYRDLTEDIAPISRHWQSLSLSFDSVYTGFLGSFEQLDLVSEFFDSFRTKDNLIFVDPVMADNGELYKIFTPEFAAGMAGLCAKADLIIPNLTEAALLTGEKYLADHLTKDYVEHLLIKLSELGPQKVILTGVGFEDGSLGAAAFDKKRGTVSYAFSEKVEGFYHGTGDVFASAVLSALLNGKELSDAIRIAVDFTVASIKKTKEAGTDVRFGVNFEQNIPGFLKSLSLV